MAADPLCDRVRVDYRLPGRPDVAWVECRTHGPTCENLEGSA